MPCKTETTQFGEHEVSVTQWPADKSVLMKFRLAKVLGNSLMKMASLANKKNTNEEKMDAVAGAIESLFQNSNPEDISTLLKDVVVGAAFDGTRITQTSYNELFSGDNLMLLYKIFFFVIKVNYSNFIPSRLGETFQAEMAKMDQGETPQKK